MTATTTSPPEAPQLEIPSRLRVFGEAAVVAERFRLHLALDRLVRDIDGDGSTVVVVPGFATTDGWTKTLRRFLDDVGYRVHGWGLGHNHGNVEALLPEVEAVFERHADATGGPVKAVGWSLGGYLAREVARDRPDLVERIVTLGSPIIGGPKYTLVGRTYRRKGVDVDHIEKIVLEREDIPLQTPVVAVYSRRDGIVAWQACIDRFNPDVEHIEVDASHLGMIFNPDVYRVIAERLVE